MATDNRSHQLPSSMVAEGFGEVNVRQTAAGVEVSFTIMMEPVGADAEGWQTGVALDGSASMKNWYGRNLTGKVPPDVLKDYERRGWVERRVEDGRSVMSYQKAGFDDAIQKGYLKFTDNIVQPASREFISYLAGNLDADGGTTVIFWACGASGKDYEVLGDFTAEQCRELTIDGPKTVGFGGGTHLTPAVKYFVERFADAKRGMYVFLTDGRLDDLESVKKYTSQLAREIQAGKRNPVKCVLIGVGTDVDERQMEELDDLDTGTEVDIWDHKIHQEMRGLVEIFAEVVSENTIVAPMGAILDMNGNVVKKFVDGVPAAIAVTLPPKSQWFELEIGDMKIRQSIVTK